MTEKKLTPDEVAAQNQAAAVEAMMAKAFSKRVSTEPAGRDGHASLANLPPEGSQRCGLIQGNQRPWVQKNTISTATLTAQSAPTAALP